MLILITPTVLADQFTYSSILKLLKLWNLKENVELKTSIPAIFTHITQKQVDHKFSNFDLLLMLFGQDGRMSTLYIVSNGH